MKKFEFEARTPCEVSRSRTAGFRQNRWPGLREAMLLLLIALSQVACTSSSPSSPEGDGDKDPVVGGGGGGGGGGGPLQMVAFSREVGGQLDLFAIAEDGSGGVVTLADDTGDEVFGGWTSDNRVIYARDMGGGSNDVFSISDDGIGVPVGLATGPEDELPVAVTSANEVVFMRSLSIPGPHTDLLSIGAGGGIEVPLAVSDDSEFLVALSSDDRVIYQRLEGGTQFDLYSNLADGSGSPMPLATTAAVDEAFGALTGSDVVVFARTLAGPQNDVITIPADGMTLESALVATGDDELPVDVTAGDLVIFIRITGTVFNLLSVGVSGTPAEVQLASANLASFVLLTYGGSTTGGHVIYGLCDVAGECDVFSRIADGSGPPVPLADDPVLNEVFAGISSDGLVIIIRDDGATTELISINVNGTGEIPLASAPTPAFPGEVFKGVTANGRVIFEREVSGQTDLFSILADGSAAEVPLADGGTNESFGGLFR